MLGSMAALIVLLYVFAFARIGETSEELQRRRIQFTSGQEMLVEVADELSEQVAGLSFRENLLPGTGMLFTYPEKDERLFWMKDMRFAIDIVWIADGVIVEIERDVPPTAADETPRIYVSPTDVDMVLEVPAGYMRGQGIEIGAHINVTDVREELP